MSRILASNLIPAVMKQTVRAILEASVGAAPFKKQVFSIIRLFNPPKRIWNLLRFQGRFKVAVDENVFFYMNNYGQGFENGIFWRGLFKGWGEEQPVQLWMKLCKGANTILDVGANMGVYSLVAKAVNPQSRVYGFEPVAHIYRKFSENCETNGFDITCIHTALSNVNGSADIYIKPGGLTTASLMANALRTEREQVETMTLSTFIESNVSGNVDLMKIDVEGYEPAVLEGMGEYLGAMTPTIIIEILSDQVGRNIETLVRKCSYLFFNIDELLGPIPQQHLSVEGKSRHSRNFLLCKEAVANKLNLKAQGGVHRPLEQDALDPRFEPSPAELHV